jgi:hypothetical protein
VNKSKVKVAAAAMACLAIAAAAFFATKGNGNLVLRNGDTGEEYARYAFQPGESFSITFIHSVNQSPVTDSYDVDEEGQIWLRTTTYYDFGAGVPFDLNEGETLSYAEDGAMVISGIDRVIAPFYLFVGTVSDHTLAIHGEEISLRELCGRNTKLWISYQPPWYEKLWQ